MEPVEFEERSNYSVTELYGLLIEVLEGQTYVPVGTYVRCNLSVPNECGSLAYCSACKNRACSSKSKTPYCQCYERNVPLLENGTCLNYDNFGPGEVPTFNLIGFEYERLKSENGPAFSPAAYFWLIAVPIVFIFLGVYVYFKKRSSSRSKLAKRMAPMEAQLSNVHPTSVFETMKGNRADEI